MVDIKTGGREWEKQRHRRRRRKITTSKTGGEQYRFRRNYEGVRHVHALTSVALTRVGISVRSVV